MADGDDMEELRKREALLDEKVRSMTEPLRRIHTRLVQVRDAYAALSARAQGEDLRDDIFLASSLALLRSIGSDLEKINSDFSAELDELHQAERELVQVRRYIMMATVN